MSYEMKENTGNLFKNDKKTDKHPDYRGEVNIEGQKYYLSAWIREGKKGKYMSLSFTKADAKQAEKQPNNQSNDDLPW